MSHFFSHQRRHHELMRYRRLHGMEHFHAQQVEMGTTEHLALQKFEAVDMPLRDAITPLGRESGPNSSIISTNPVDKTAQFGHMTGFGALEPAVQCLLLAFFEHGHKLLAQEVDGAEFLVAVHLLHLVLLSRRQLRGW